MARKLWIRIFQAPVEVAQEFVHKVVPGLVQEVVEKVVEELLEKVVQKVPQAHGPS